MVRKTMRKGKGKSSNKAGLDNSINLIVLNAGLIHESFIPNTYVLDGQLKLMAELENKWNW